MRNVNGIIIILVVLSAFPNILHMPWEISSISTREGPQSTLSYTEHSPVIITNDTDFEIQGWPGLGTKEQPYLISELNITTNTQCIDIRDTTVHFEIRNCILTADGSDLDRGLFLENVTNAKVRNCIITSNSNGVRIADSFNCILINNTAYENKYSGFHLAGVTNCIIQGNNASWNPHGGILVGDFPNFNCTVIENHVEYNSDYGIRIVALTGGRAIGNTALENVGAGVQLLSTNRCTLANNTVLSSLNHGYEIGNCYDCTIINNTAINTNWPGLVVGDTSNCTFSRNIVNNSGSFGVYIEDSRNCTFMENAVGKNRNDGFYLLYAENCTLSHNLVFNNTKAGFLLRYSNSSIFAGNTVFNNSAEGFLIEDSSSDNQLYLNRIGPNNGMNALDNGISNTWDDGKSEGNYWTDYNLSGKYEIPGAAGSVDNYPHLLDITPPYIDSPDNLQFEDGTEGHSITWKVYDLHPALYQLLHNGSLIEQANWTATEIQKNVDRFGLGVHNVTLVLIDFFGNWASDSVFVTISDTTPPVINSPQDVVTSEDTTGQSITWTVFDENPHSFILFVNNSIHDSGSWDGNPITFILDDLQVGVWNLTLIVRDVCSLSSQDTVMVNITEASPSFSFLDFGFGALALLATGIIVIAVKSFKKRD